MGSCPMGGPRRTAHDRSRAPRAGPPSNTAFGGTNHHHGPCEPSLRSFRTGLRRGGAKIPEIRKHPPETGPQNRPRFLTPLAFLSPRIVAAIANGDVPAGVTVSGLVRSLPFNWAEQQRRFTLCRNQPAAHTSL